MDIYLEAEVTAPATWTPIGSEKAPFTGNFYGNGHTISGVNVNPTLEENREYAGFFGEVEGTADDPVTISDLTVEVEVNNEYQRTSGEKAGSKAAKNGGLIGHAKGSVEISHVTVNGSVTSSKTSGGFIAEAVNDNFVGAQITITDSVNNASLCSPKAAGFVGQVERSQITLVHCTNNGAITLPANEEDVAYSNDNRDLVMGGFIGYIMRTEDSVTLIDCKNTGDITADISYYVHKLNIGGIISTTHYGSAYLTDVRNEGDIVVHYNTTAEKTEDSEIGGLVGSSSSTVEMTRVENENTITFDTKNSADILIGGLVGDVGTLTVNGCLLNVTIDATWEEAKKPAAISVGAATGNNCANVSIANAEITAKVNPLSAHNYGLSGTEGEYASITDTTYALVHDGYSENRAWDSNGELINKVTDLTDGAELSDILSQAEEGEVVNLAEGNYSLPTSIQTEGVVIEGAGEGTVIEISAETTQTTISAANVTLRNLSFQTNTADDDTSHVLHLTGEGITIENCNFEAVSTQYTLISLGSSAKNTTIKGCHFVGGFRQIGWSYGSPDTTTTIEGCTFEKGVYGVHFDNLRGATLVVRDCEIAAWNSFSSEGKAIFERTTFKAGGSNNRCRPYVDTDFIDCVFGDDFCFDVGKSGITINVVNATLPEGKSFTDMIDDKAHTFTLKIDGVESTYQPA